MFISFLCMNADSNVLVWWYNVPQILWHAILVTSGCSDWKHKNFWAWNGWCFMMSGVSVLAEARAGFCVFCWPSWTVLFQYTWDKEHVCLSNIQTGGTPYVYFIYFRLAAIYYKTDDRAALSRVILKINYLLFASTDRTSFNLSVLLVLSLWPSHGQALNNLHFGIYYSCGQWFLIYTWRLFSETESSSV